MAFFSEVKAKLGLDISPFERGLKQAQNSVGGLTKGLGKQFASTEKLAGALAAALGLNMQSIADSIARFITGFSKKAEDSLKDLVQSSDAAADKQEANLEALKRKQQTLIKEIADKEEEIRVSRISDKEREIELVSEQAKLLNIVYQFEKSANTTSIKYLESRSRLLDVQKEIIELEGKQAKDEEQKRKKIDALREKEKEFSLKILTDAERLNALAGEQAKLLGINTIDAKERVLEIDEEIFDITQKQTQEYKNQLGQLEAQKKEVVKTLAEYAKKQKALPTTDDVRSGKRNIGSGARRQVSELDKSQDRIRRLEDAEQRKREELDGAKSEGDRRRFMEEGRKIRSEKEKEIGRSERLKGGLEGRVSDIETNKQSLEQLKSIEKGIKDLNQKLEPTDI